MGIENVVLLIMVLSFFIFFLWFVVRLNKGYKILEANANPINNKAFENLTNAQKEIVQCILENPKRTNKEIAKVLNKSYNTVKELKRQVYMKLLVKNHQELVYYSMYRPLTMDN